METRPQSECDECYTMRSDRKLIETSRERPERSNYAISIRSLDGNVVRVAAKPAQNIGAFWRRLKAFEVYMAVYLSQPGNVPEAAKLLQYVGRGYVLSATWLLKLSRRTHY